MSGPSDEFVYEASSQIERLSDGFVDLQQDGFDRATLDDLFRGAHTLKGNCAAEGLAAPRDTAHALEDLLDGARANPEAFDDSYVDAALAALDVLERQLTELQTGGDVETEADDAIAEIRELIPDRDDGDGASDATSLDDVEVPEPDEDVTVEEALENASVFDDLESLEAGVETEEFEAVDGIGVFDDEGSTPVTPQEDEEGVTSSTRRDSESIPGESDYADVVRDTDRADPDELQSELEDVSFGEFDEDDDLSIGDLVDRAEAVDDGESAAPSAAETAGDERETDAGATAADEEATGPAPDADRGATDAEGVETPDAGAEFAVDDAGGFDFGEPDDLAAPDDGGDGTPTTGATPPTAPDEETPTADASADEETPTADDREPTDTTVSDIVDHIERLDDGDGDDAPDDGPASERDSAPTDDSASERDPTPADDRVSENDPTPSDAGLDDVVDAVTAPEASTTEPDILPSDVPDVDELLAETDFEDADDAAFAAAELYDRVGFEPDSATGAFVSEFAAEFGDDRSGGVADRSPRGDAAATIDSSVLGTDDAESRDADVSTSAVREVSLDVEEADELLELTEELAVSTRRLAGTLGDLPPEAADALSTVRDVSARIENHVTGVRLVPLETATAGLARTVRRAGRTADKEVTFLTENDTVEVDRRVAEELGDPLAHLVRNAVAHGIEPPEERVAANKPREGTVLVRADRDGETVTVAVEDDGRGVDADDLRAEAVAEDLYTEREAAALSRDEALELMFHPGLSTTDDVSEVSGRGVGMDVVADTVTRLEGTIDVESEPGVGTTVTLTLPVSVALSEVLVVTVGDRRFGLPATAVRRVEELDPERVDGDRYRPANTDDDEAVPLVDLGAELGVDDARSAGPRRPDVAVLVEQPERRALRCSDLVDWRSLVLQPFDGTLRDLDAVRGAALVGDGPPVVVLEPAALGGGR